MSSVHPAILQQPLQRIVQQAPPSPGAAGPTSSSGGFGNVLKNAAIFGGIGALAGAGVALLGIPVIGGLGAPITAAIGGALGLAIGAVRGILQNRHSAPPAVGQSGGSVDASQEPTQPPPPPSL